MNSGRARGGPYNTRFIHHPEGVYRICVLASDHNSVVPAQRGEKPEYVFGSYVWQPALEEWFWDKRSINPYRETPKPVNKQKSEETL